METILEKINKAAIKFLQPLSGEEIYKIIVDEAMKLIHADYGSIFLQNNKRLERIYATDKIFNNVNIKRSGYVYKVFHTNKPLVTTAARIIKLHPPMEMLDIESVILMPLSYKKETIGVLAIYSKQKEHFSQKELQILKLFGSMASLAIKKTQLYEETKQALDVRDRFISLASHELRTPLTSINGYIQLLYSRMAKQDTNEAKWIRELQNESVRLTNLVKELLEINRVKTGQLQFTFQECHLSDIVTTAVRRAKMSNPERKILIQTSLTIKTDAIIGDSDKLLQVFSSIINNAIKFSPNESTIILSMGSDKTMLRITFHDNGRGIQDKDLNHVFEGFYKARDNLKEGMGVGLMLSKHIIEYHQGKIRIDSQIDSGTSIEVSLPKLKK